MAEIYGSPEWLEHRFKLSDDDPWGHDWRGVEKYRYDLIIGLIAKYSLGDKRKTKIPKILDIGCSTGDFTHRLARFSKDIIGIDIAQTAIDRAKRKFNKIDFRTSYFPESTLERNSFDLITCLEVLYYLEKTSQERFLSEVNALLNLGGISIITSLIGKRPYFDSDSLIRMTSEYLQIEHVEYYYAKIYYRIENVLLRKFNQANKLFKLLAAKCQIPEKELGISNVLRDNVFLKLLCKTIKNKFLRSAIMNLLKLTMFIIKKALSGKYLPKLSHYGGRQFPALRTHIFILAKKLTNNKTGQLLAD